jgi:hypothetical protein
MGFSVAVFGSGWLLSMAHRFPRLGVDDLMEWKMG